MSNEQSETRNTFAGVFASNETIEQMDYWQAKDMARKLRDYSDTCELDEREAINASIVLADKRASALAGTDGSYAESDQQEKNKEIVEDMLKAGNMKGALAMTKSLKESGQQVPDVTIDKAKVKPYLDAVEKARKERVPILMRDLQINEQEAGEWFESFESHAYLGSPPNLLGAEPAPPPAKPEPAKGSLPSDDHDGYLSSKP